jgi:hypothetical protein
MEVSEHHIRGRALAPRQMLAYRPQPEASLRKFFRHRGPSVAAPKARQWPGDQNRPSLQSAAVSLVVKLATQWLLAVAVPVVQFLLAASHDSTRFILRRFAGRFSRQNFALPHFLPVEKTPWNAP